MASVTRQDNESIERLISRLRRVVLRSGKLKQVRKARYFKRPPRKSEIRVKAAYREVRKAESLINEA